MKFETLLLLLLLAVVGCSEAADSAPGEVRDISQADFVASAPVGATILDVRTAEEYAAGHVPNAINIPHDELASRVSELAAGPDAPVVVYCERGGRASKAAGVLQDAGFNDILHLDGDMMAWRAAGLPMTRAE